MIKLFWADLRQLKRTFLVLVLSLPILHILDSVLYRIALPTTVMIRWGDTVSRANEFFTAYSGWFFAMIASMILLLFSADSGSQGRLPSLLSLPLSRRKIAVLRHLPAVTIIPVLGLLLTLLRFVLGFFEAFLRTDAWREHRSISWGNVQDCLLWSFDKIANIFGTGYASILYQLVGWICISLLISAIPLLIDDIWPQIKRSSFALWLSVSLFAGIALQAGIFILGKVFDLDFMPHLHLPSGLSTAAPYWQPSMMGIEVALALGILGLELWWFQRRSSYVG